MKHQSPTRLLYTLAIGLFCIGVGLLGWFGLQLRAEQSGTVTTSSLQLAENTPEKPCALQRLFDGVCVETVEETTPPLVAIMVENHREARPQAGLARAAVVYEAPVEANYTRFLALYPASETIEKVGPVRSARPYFVEWVREWGDPMYMHVGGSPDALEDIEALEVFDVNEFYRGWYFWRSAERFAPHNTYTASKLWQKAWEDYGNKRSKVAASGWNFASRAACEVGCIRKITVSFLPPVYEAVWQYTSSTQQYTRYQMGQPHTDDDGRTIVANTIIVQRVTTQVLDAVGRLGLETVAKGEALVFRDGHMIRGTWYKKSVSGKTRWLDEAGKEIPLKAGPIWVEVVPHNGSVTTL